jgi:hypothetical protein
MQNVWQHHFPEPCGDRRCGKKQHFVNLMKTIDSSIPCSCQPGGGHGDGHDGSSPVLFPLHGDIGQRTAPSFFFSLPTSLSLSTISQGGDREFSWSGFPLMLVFTHAKVGTSDMGQPSPVTIRLLPNKHPSLTPILSIFT